MINREQLAWAAGLHDGEGCVSYTPKAGGRMITLTLSQSGSTIPEALIRFRNSLGIGKIYGPYTHSFRGKEGKLKWTYQVSGHEKVQAIVAMLWRWLCYPKREQAKIALKKYREYPLVRS